MAELKITNLCKKYEDDFEAVRDFNLEARDGEFIVIVGPSGCGKSTTLRMIAGLEQPSAGSILLDGMVIDYLPPQKRDMAMIFQNYALYENMTAFDNIAFPLKVRGLKKAEIASKVTAAAEMLKISELLNRKPGALSGGEKQRIAIARIMLKNAPIVILDEATAFTDPENEDKLQKSIEELTKGKTLLVIAHRLSTITDADQIVVLKNGRIEAKGTQAQLLENCPLYERMWQAHVGARHWAVGGQKGGEPICSRQ